LTPGGSLHPGEPFEDALLREIFEETGLRLSHPGHWVWSLPKRIVRDGQPVDPLARVYIQRVPAFEPMPTALTPEEHGIFRALRWWSTDEIAASSETFIPRQLAVLLKPLLTAAWSAEPPLAGLTADRFGVAPEPWHIALSGQQKFLPKSTCHDHRQCCRGRDQTHHESSPSPEGEGFAHPRCGTLNLFTHGQTVCPKLDAETLIKLSDGITAGRERELRALKERFP
jgi:ADP-ribose pyrophosphatase YjhB (NUDIX family)